MTKRHHDDQSGTSRQSTRGVRFARVLRGLGFGGHRCYTLPDKGGGCLEGGDSYLGHRKRLRERFRQAGIAGFAPHEALELLLCYAIPRRDTKPLAYALLERFGSLEGVFSASLDELSAVHGIGENAATLIALMLPLFRLYSQSQVSASESLREADARLRYCRALMLGERYEKLYLLALDPKGGLLSKTLISAGDEGETAVYPRLIVAALLRAGAAQALLCHNHPDGDPKPSQADIRMTSALTELLLPLQVRLIDHIIVAKDRVYSFAAQGKLER